jgi:tRNA(Ile)-lysidine synthetase-like protein
MNGCKAMADSTTPKPTLVDALRQAALPAALSLDHFHPPLPFAVALSGGADSCALLLACAKQWPGQVRAVHVHHGLQSAADLFAAHCQQLCDQLHLPLLVQHVKAQHAPGESPEDAARQARYAALSEALQKHWGGKVRDVALAQHADDQVETILLALSRGAGLPGLSAMPERIERQGLVLHRPWLAVPGAALREWLQSLGVSWVEDPSNSDTRFTPQQNSAPVVACVAGSLSRVSPNLCPQCKACGASAKLVEGIGRARCAAHRAPAAHQSLANAQPGPSSQCVAPLAAAKRGTGQHQTTGRFVGANRSLSHPWPSDRHQSGRGLCQARWARARLVQFIAFPDANLYKMALIVHKYGGTSMGSTERIQNVAKRVAKWAKAGHQMVVVPRP